MGSGGGGGGGSPGGRKKRARAGSGNGGGVGGGGSGGPDFEPTSCQISFETDLSAIDGEVTEALEVDDVLLVGTVKKGNFDAIVCRTTEGHYVGTVSHIENLAQLLGCIRAGVGYQAHVRAVSATYCTVFILNE